MKFPKGFLDRLAGALGRRQAIRDRDIPHRDPRRFLWFCPKHGEWNWTHEKCPLCGHPRPSQEPPPNAVRIPDGGDTI